MARRLTRGQVNIRWIEKHCRIPEGRDVGKKVVLRFWQRRIIRRIYDSPTRTAIISFGRKNAKTALAAFLTLLHLAGPEGAKTPNGQLYSSAQSKEQAAILFALAAKIVRMSPTLHPVISILDSAKQLYCPGLGTVYMALSAEAKTKLGLSPVFIVHDELGQVKGPRDRLYEALETASGAWDETLSIITSTQAATDADLLSILIDDALADNDPLTKLFLYTAPVEDPPFTKRTIRKANPAFGDFLSDAETMSKASAARRMPAREAAYRNLILNQRIDVVSPFIPRVTWNKNQLPPLESAFETGILRLGLDLSARNDLTALALRVELDGISHCRVEFFAPLRHVAERAMRDRVPYDLWARAGHIRLTPGASVDYSAIARRLVEICEQYEVESIAFDRWRIDVLEAAIDHLRDDQGNELDIELPLIPHGQGFKDMAPALDLFEGELLNFRCRLGNNPVMNMCAANAAIDTDPAGNRKLNKKKSTGRIDGMVALAMTFGHAAVEVDEYAVGSMVSI